jgi:hypothetical protein
MTILFDKRQNIMLEWAVVVSIIIALIGLYSLLGLAIARRFDDFCNQLMAHAVVIVGLGGMGMASALLVIVFKQIEGPIEFGAGWIKFKGAAGPVVLWIITFLAMVGGSRMLWFSN